MSKNRNNEFFPIWETTGEAGMKNISPNSLPHFHGLASKDPNIFMFDFVVVCRTYDYTYDEQKLNFPSSLKDATLCSFMSLPGGNITTWPQMQQAFNEKYMDYYRSKEIKE